MSQRRPWVGGLWCACSLAAAAVAACGGTEEVVRAPETSKVVWGDGNAEPATEEAEREVAEEEAPAPKAPPPAPAPVSSDDSEEQAALAAGAIDLDAPSAPPARAARAAAPARAEKPAEGDARDSAASERAPAARATRERSTKAAPAEAGEARAPEAPAAEPSPDAPPPLAELQRRRNQREKAEAGNKKESAEEAPEPAPEAPSPAYKGAEPCRATSFTIARVRAACENGGRPGAKRVMKEAINKAVATGQVLKCADCHSSTTAYTLKSDAAEKLQSWLER